jgi:hypothetical protein
VANCNLFVIKIHRCITAPNKALAMPCWAGRYHGQNDWGKAGAALHKTDTVGHGAVLMGKKNGGHWQPGWIWFTTLDRLPMAPAYNNGCLQMQPLGNGVHHAFAAQVVQHDQIIIITWAAATTAAEPEVDTGKHVHGGI